MDYQLSIKQDCIGNGAEIDVDWLLRQQKENVIWVPNSGKAFYPGPNLNML